MFRPHRLRIFEQSAPDDVLSIRAVGFEFLPAVQAKNGKSDYSERPARNRAAIAARCSSVYSRFFRWGLRPNRYGWSEQSAQGQSRTSPG